MICELPSCRSEKPEGKLLRRSSPFPEDPASTLPIQPGTSWPLGLRVDAKSRNPSILAWKPKLPGCFTDFHHTPTGKGLGEDSSALAPMRKRSNLPSSRDIRPVYQ